MKKLVLGRTGLKVTRIGLIAMKPFGGGRLGNARLCMGYIFGLDNVAAAVGVDSVQHVQEFVELAKKPPLLNDDDRST
ncbi:MAG: hypothetical protein ABIG61_08235 [Planctomycetota bacterium]